MEHIIQFGVSIDDDAIQKKVQEQAANKVISELNKVLGTNAYFAENKIKQMVDKRCDEFFAEHRDAIIEKTSVLLTEKLMRSKKVREMVDDVFGTLEKA